MLRPLTLSVFSALLAAGCGEKEHSGDDSNGVTDDDSDGFTSDVDCDDDDAAVNPDATESCNLGDDDCDGQIDEGVTTTFYADADGDGAGNANATLETCSQPQGYVSAGDDCDDSDASASPSGTEVCDGVDNDCDDSTDEGVTSTFFADADLDGYGDPEVTVEACEAGEGATTDDSDCDDADSTAYPGADEVCDGADNDCDGVIEAGGVVSWSDNSDGIGGWSDVSAEFVGGGGEVIPWTSSQDGALCFGAGDHAVSLTLEHSVSVLGAGQAVTTLSTGGSGSVLVLAVDGETASVRDLTMQDGAASRLASCGYTAGSTVRTSGGLICCEGLETTLNIERVTLNGGQADVAGAIYAEDCDVNILQSTITGNSATYGGGAVILYGGDHLVQDSTFSDNSTQGDGGAFYLISTSDTTTNVSVLDSIFEDNSVGDDGGAFFLAGSSAGRTANVTASGTQFASNNAVDTGGAVFLYFYASFDCQDCDLSDSADDNTPDDIYVGELATGFTYGDGATFTCDETGCQ